MPRRLGISNQLIPICTPASNNSNYIIPHKHYGTIIEHFGVASPKL